MLPGLPDRDLREVDRLDARHGEELRHEVEELRASRRRLVLAADDDRRRIERELHEGVQQRLVALSVNLQLAGRVVESDLAAAKDLLDEMGRDLQRAVDEVRQLAERIYPPLLESGGLAVALRSAAGAAATIEVAGDLDYEPEVAGTVYLCCLEALERGAATSLRNEDGAIVFELVEDADSAEADIQRIRDRVEALGGRLTVEPDPGGGTRVSASLPLSG